MANYGPGPGYPVQHMNLCVVGPGGPPPIDGCWTFTGTHTDGETLYYDWEYTDGTTSSSPSPGVPDLEGYNAVECP